MPLATAPTAERTASRSLTTLRTNWRVYAIDGALQSGNMTIKIKDTKVRADVAMQMSTIMDGATGDTITLMHSQKSFMTGVLRLENVIFYVAVTYFFLLAATKTLEARRWR